MTGQQSLEFALRFLHMVGAAGLLGGIVFMRFGLWPALTGVNPEERERVFGSAARKYAPWVGVFAACVLISGIYNMIGASRFSFPGKYYNAVVGVKLIIGIGVIGLFSILCGRTALAEKFRRNAAMWLDLCLVLTLAIVLMGGLLRIAERVEKAPNASTVKPSPGEQG